MDWLMDWFEWLGALFGTGIFMGIGLCPEDDGGGDSSSSDDAKEMRRIEKEVKEQDDEETFRQAGRNGGRG